MPLIQPIIKQNPSLSPPILTNHKTSSTVFFARNIIIVGAIMFFICGLLHVLVRCLKKKKSSSNFHHQSPRFQESANERQLQQLFNLHDSGLDQEFIDALPVFIYKDLMGLKEPFHCAVCLCEFSEQDNLRLIPVCGHAFHIQCIDTWLLSNSTCPLCRGTLFVPGFSVVNPLFDFDFEESNSGRGVSGNLKQSEKRVYPVRLGKFRPTNEEKGEELGEGSNGNLDGRRCFSMGSYEYVVANSDLLFCPDRGGDRRGIFGNDDLGIEKDKVKVNGNWGIDGKKIGYRSKGESFSVSKIWLWSKTDCPKSQSSSGIHMVNPSVNISLPRDTSQNM